MVISLCVVFMQTSIANFITNLVATVQKGVGLSSASKRNFVENKISHLPTTPDTVEINITMSIYKKTQQNL